MEMGWGCGDGLGDVEMGWAMAMGWGRGGGLGTWRCGSQPAQEQSGWSISIPGDACWSWTYAPVGHPPPQQARTPTHGTRHQGTRSRRTGTPGTRTPLMQSFQLYWWSQGRGGAAAGGLRDTGSADAQCWGLLSGEACVPHAAAGC